MLIAGRLFAETFCNWTAFISSESFLCSKAQIFRFTLKFDDCLFVSLNLHKPTAVALIIALPTVFKSFRDVYNQIETTMKFEYV